MLVCRAMYIAITTPQYLVAIAIIYGSLYVVVASLKHGQVRTAQVQAMPHFGGGGSTTCFDGSILQAMYLTDLRHRSCDDSFHYACTHVCRTKMIVYGTATQAFPMKRASGASRWLTPQFVVRLTKSWLDSAGRLLRFPTKPTILSHHASASRHLSNLVIDTVFLRCHA